MMKKVTYTYVFVPAHGLYSILKNGKSIGVLCDDIAECLIKIASLR